jgi:hypothetical protein
MLFYQFACKGRISSAQQIGTSDRSGSLGLFWQQYLSIRQFIDPSAPKLGEKSPSAFLNDLLYDEKFALSLEHIMDPKASLLGPQLRNIQCGQFLLACVVRIDG